TRDQSLREPFSQDTASILYAGVTIDLHKNIRIALSKTNQPSAATLWSKDIPLAKQDTPIPFDYLPEITATEALSRTDIPAALKAQGITGAADNWLPTANLPPNTNELLNQWNLVAQFLAVQ